MRTIKVLTRFLFITSVFLTGFGVRICVKVFMVRSVPVIHGGGELMILFAIPAALYIGYRSGCDKSSNHNENKYTGGKEDE